MPRRLLLIVATFLVLSARPALAGREFSLDLWDWTTPCRDLATFKLWAADLKRIGVTRVEISAPWNLLEPRPGAYDLTFVTDRLAVCKSLGLGMRIRINSFHSGATPSWYAGDRWCDVNDRPPVGTDRPPSIADERFWASFGPLCTRIAAAVRGEDVYLNAFIGVHAELKFGDWWSYDPSALAQWRTAIQDRPAWLLDIAGDLPLPERPPIPPPTRGTPDNSAVSKSWIAFREQLWRDAMRRFAAACRAGDVDAKISAPLGESFRRESAAFSNLDYHGLSRGASQVVHSYDFFWHGKDDPWHAAAAVAAFRGITGVDHIAFEFDGPNLIDNLGYTETQLLDIARAAMSQGAGLKTANFSYFNLPSTYPLLSHFSELAASATSSSPPPLRDKTVLLFLSKWANYCYREPTEWLHDAQLGAWHMLTSHDVPVRIICEDNLDEDLSTYRGLYIAFSPPELIPPSRRAKLDALKGKLPNFAELAHAPLHPPTPTGATLAYRWLKGDRATAERELAEVLNRFK